MVVRQRVISSSNDRSVIAQHKVAANLLMLLMMIAGASWFVARTHSSANPAPDYVTVRTGRAPAKDVAADHDLD